MSPGVACTWSSSLTTTPTRLLIKPLHRRAQTRRFYKSSLYSCCSNSRLVNARVGDRTPTPRWSIPRKHFSASSGNLATKDPYRVLGVNQTSSASEIKKAYYTLAKKYHPDTNKDANAKERFSEAQSAYELLQDPKKKEIWDQYGAAAFDQNAGFDPSSGGGAGGNPFAGGGGAGGPFQGFGGGFGQEFNFEDLFGAFTGQGRRGRGGSRQSPFQEETLVGENIEVNTNISFMDAAKGVAKDIFITPLVSCETCHGGGLKKGTQRRQCLVCKGTGTNVHFVQQGFQMASTCEACGGQGVSIPRGSECSTCGGNGVTRQRKTVHVDIPGGVEDGMRLRVSGEGDAAATGMAANPNAKSSKGDLYVFIRVASDSRFSRSGADVVYTATIPLTTALLGGEVTVPTLDGEVKVKVSTGTGTGDKITLSGMGMKRLAGRRATTGDLRVYFKVGMPKYLNANQRTILEMLADEMNDKTARRIMNVGQYQKPDESAKTSSTSSADTNNSSSEKESDQHKNEGFLKSAWHKLTNQHNHLNPDPGSNAQAHPTPSPSKPTTKPASTSTNEPNTRSEEPKKASGSG